MKKHLWYLLILLPGGLLAQARVNEPCSPSKPCNKGLYCVETRDKKFKCAECDQVTLKKLSSKVDDACKSAGWTPATSPEHKDALTSDGRISIAVLDIMIAGAEACLNARITREVTCWDGGDPAHEGEVKKAETSFENWKEHKERMIKDKRVYYCEKTVYEDLLTAYKSSLTGFNITDLKNYLDGYEKKLNAGEKIDCVQAGKQLKICQKIFDATDDLQNKCFKGSRSYYPVEFEKVYVAAFELEEKYTALIKKANDKKLCK